MRVIYATHGHSGYIPPLPLSAEQVIIGPNYPDADTPDGRPLSRRTGQEFDMRLVLRTLPADFVPDLFVALVDAWFGSVPRHVDSLPCPTVLLIADTHHGAAPVTDLLRYAREERYHRLSVTHDPHHLHWFAKAGLEPVACHLNLNVRDFGVPFAEQRQPHIVFVGQTSSQHSRRGRLLQLLIEQGLPVSAGADATHNAAKRYAKAQLTFNCSLNGDLNMRVFEALSAGACLLTDRLSLASGLDQHFTDGQHLITYDDDQDLLDKARYYLARPDDCLAIARAGHERYQSLFSESRRRQTFLDYALGDARQAQQCAQAAQQHDPRSNERCDPDTLEFRAATYQTIQELQRRELIRDVTFSDRIPQQQRTDFSDLNTVRLSTNASDPSRTALIATVADLTEMAASRTPCPARYLVLADATMDSLIPLGMAMMSLRLQDANPTIERDPSRPGWRGRGGWLFTAPVAVDAG